MATAGRAERRVQRLDNREHFRPGDAVVDGGALAPRLDQPVRPQPHELLRHRHLLDFELLTQFGNRLLFVAQRTQNQKALRMRQAAQQLGGLSGGRYHFFYIHVIEFKKSECYMQDRNQQQVVVQPGRGGQPCLGVAERCDRSTKIGP
jgi:hypothetical protein